MVGSEDLISLLILHISIWEMLLLLPANFMGQEQIGFGINYRPKGGGAFHETYGKLSFKLLILCYVISILQIS